MWKPVKLQTETCETRLGHVWAKRATYYMKRDKESYEMQNESSQNSSYNSQKPEIINILVVDYTDELLGYSVTPTVEEIQSISTR